MDKKSYFIFNFLIAGIFTTLFVYACFFAYNSHSVGCIYIKTFGKPCPTCGITRAFSEILHFNFTKAYQLNNIAPWLFSFFFLQLIVRLIINFILKKREINISKILKIDVSFSILLFVICFYKLIIAIF